MSKIADAITKIALECKEPGLQRVIGTYLQSIIKNNEIAELILTEDKSLKGCCEEITSKARKNAVSGCAAVEDNEVYGWAREYFCINELMLGSEKPVTKTAPKSISIFDYM